MNGVDPYHSTYEELEMKPSYREIAGLHVEEEDIPNANQDHNTIPYAFICKPKSMRSHIKADYIHS